MRFKKYREFETNIKADQLILKFCPYPRAEIITGIELILEHEKSVEWLFEVLKENPNLDINSAILKGIKDEQEKIN